MGSCCTNQQTLVWAILCLAGKGFIDGKEPQSPRRVAGEVWLHSSVSKLRGKVDRSVLKKTTRCFLLFECMLLERTPGFSFGSGQGTFQRRSPLSEPLGLISERLLQPFFCIWLRVFLEGTARTKINEMPRDENSMYYPVSFQGLLVFAVLPGCCGWLDSTKWMEKHFSCHVLPSPVLAK